MEKKYWEISWGSLWRIVTMLFLISFFYYSRNIFIAVFLAIVISSALDPIVSFFERKKIPRVLGALIIFLSVLVVLALLLYIVVPVVLAELSTLIENLASVQSSLFGFKEVSDLIKSFNENIGKIANILFSGSTSLSEVVSKFFGNLVLAVSVFMLSFYLTIDRDGVEKFLKAILPQSFEEKALSIYSRTRYKIGKWLQGQIFLSLSIGLSVSIGLWLLGVRYSLVIGILAAILEMVPFVGPIISGLIAFIIAFSQSASLGLYVLALFILIQQAEGHILVPVFMKLTTDLHPAMVLIALLIGGELLGVVGIILAVPAAVLAQEIINHWNDSKSRRKALF